MNEKIVLIDGHSILNRAFYGIPDLTNAEGLHTNAIYGFLNILFKILEEEQPEYLTVAFDVHAKTFRHELYHEYKGTRKPMADELREQVPVMKEVLMAMGVFIIEKAGYEADDLLGTMAKSAEEQGLCVSLVSGDRDLLQLATERIKIRIPKTKRTGTEIEDYYAADVMEKYQVTPQEFIDVKALMGDVSDNIPGVPGIGEKTATNLIVTYKSIENAYANIGEIKPNRAKEALKNNYELAQLSKQLAAIDVNCEIDFALAKAKLTNLYTREAYEIFHKLGFKQFLNRFDTATRAEPDETRFQKTATRQQAGKVFRQAAMGKRLAFFLLEAKENRELMGITLAVNEDAVYFIRCNEELTASYLENELTTLLNHAETAVTMDLKRQLPYLTGLNRSDERINCFCDIQIGAYLLNPLNSSYNYEDISNEFLQKILPSRTELLGKLPLKKAMEESEEKVIQYACGLTQTAYLSYEPIMDKLAAGRMDKLFREIEMPLVFTLSDMEQEGILVNAGALKEYGRELYVNIQKIEKEIYESAGEVFNINSPKQLGVILFEKLKMPYGKKTKTGYSTAADVLDKLAAEYPIVSKILEYRQLTKLKSTYADGLAAYIEPDGRIRSSFHQTITATGRISSTEPNLQNIPIRMEIGRLIRKVFIPREGFVFVDADYSQIELRVLAHMSADKMLIEAYQQAQDIHRMTASQVFHTPFGEVTDLQRRNAKAVNFGIVYGISSFGLSQDLSISRKEAADYIDKYFETYPQVKEFLDQLVADAKRDGYVLTMFHRRRPVPELSSSNFMQRSFGERIAMNSPIQGSAADIIKIAMIRVHRQLKDRGLKSRLILQVHDELLIEAAQDELSEVKEILQTEMESAAELSVALDVDLNVGENWYDAH